MSAVQYKKSSSNIYTALVALAFATVLATAALVTYKCYFQYNEIFRLP